MALTILPLPDGDGIREDARGPWDIGLDHVDDTINPVAVEGLPLLDEHEKFLEHGVGQGHFPVVSGEIDLVSTGNQARARERVLDAFEMHVPIAQ